MNASYAEMLIHGILDNFLDSTVAIIKMKLFDY